MFRLATRLLVASVTLMVLSTTGCGGDSSPDSARDGVSSRPLTAVDVATQRAEAGAALPVATSLGPGGASAEKPVDLTYYLSLNEKRDGDDIRLEGGGRTRGAAARVDGKPRIPVSAAPGSYRVLACAGDCVASGGRVLVTGSEELPAGSERLIAAGDIAHCPVSGDEATADLLDVLPGTIAAIGDTVYERGTADEFERCYEPSWGRHRDRTRPSIGNHEYGTGDATPYFEYFGQAAGAPGDGWYSYDLGSWHVVVLNSFCDVIGGCARDSRQVRWLERDLKASDAPCTLAYFHHARFSSGAEHGSDDKVAPFWQVLHAAGADVVLSAHDHHYERFAPQDPNGVLTSDGTRQFVVGTGGKELYSLEAPLPNSEVRADDTHGVLELILRGDGYDWRFLPAAGGDATDAGSDRCRGG